MFLAYQLFFDFSFLALARPECGYYDKDISNQTCKYHHQYGDLEEKQLTISCHWNKTVWISNVGVEDGIMSLVDLSPYSQACHDQRKAP